jgi:nucleoside-diphosphate kinase
MKKEKTMIMIKPDGVQKKLIGEALARLEKAGLDITHLEIKRIKPETAKKFYEHLKNKLHPELFESIIEYITSGKVVIGLIEGKKAAKKVRKLVGPTDPKKAPKGTIRGDFSKIKDKFSKKSKVLRNIIHASESHKHAKREFEILRSQK